MIDALPDDTVWIDDSGAGELGMDDFAGLHLTTEARRKSVTTIIAMNSSWKIPASTPQ
jgi:hypothetical protein